MQCRYRSKRELSSAKGQLGQRCFTKRRGLKHRPFDSHFSNRHDQKEDNTMRVLSSSYVVFGVLIGTLLILSWQTEPCDSSSSNSRVLIWVPSVSVELQQKVSHRWSKSLMATIWASAASKQQQIKGGDEQKRLFLLKAKYYNRLSYWCSTTTVTTTSTTTISTKTFCATINGVVGACRRRKKLLIEDDDDLLADSVTNQHHLVQPTESLS